MLMACKKSGKPFKSGLKYNTVKDRCINTNTNRPAFSFVEDNSIVDEKRVKLIELPSELKQPQEEVEWD